MRGKRERRRTPTCLLVWSCSRRELSHGVRDDTRLASSKTHDADHLAEVSDMTRKHLRTESDSRAQVSTGEDGHTVFSMKDRTAEEKAAQAEAEREKKSHTKTKRKRKLENESDVSSVSWSGGSLNKNMIRKRKAMKPPTNPAAHHSAAAKKTARAGGSLADGDGWELSQKRRRKKAAVDKALLTAQHDNDEFQSCAKDANAEKLHKKAKDVWEIADGDFNALFRESNGSMSSMGIDLRKNILSTHARYLRMALLAESFTATKELEKVKKKPPAKMTEDEVNDFVWRLEQSHDPEVLSGRIEDCHDHHEAVPAVFYQELWVRQRDQLFGQKEWAQLLEFVQLKQGSLVSMTEEEVTESKQEAVDSLLSRLMWSEDSKSDFITFITLLIDSGFMAEQQVAWKAMLLLVEWRRHPMHQVIASRETVKSSSKICRQFSSLELGSKYITEVDDKLKQVKEHMVYASKLESIDRYATSGSIASQLSNPEKCVAPLAKIRFDFTSVKVQAKDGFFEAPEHKGIIEKVEAHLQSGIDSYLKHQRDSFDVDTAAHIHRMHDVFRSETATEAEVEAVFSSFTECIDKVTATMEPRPAGQTEVPDRSCLDDFRRFATKEQVEERIKIVDKQLGVLKEFKSMMSVMFLHKPTAQIDKSDFSVEQVMATLRAVEGSTHVFAGYGLLTVALKKVVPILHKSVASFVGTTITDVTGTAEFKVCAKVTRFFHLLVDSAMKDKASYAKAAKCIEEFKKCIKTTQLKQLKDISDDSFDKMDQKAVGLGHISLLLPETSDLKRKPFSFTQDSVTCTLDLGSLLMAPSVSKLMRFLVLCFDQVSSIQQKPFETEGQDAIVTMFEFATEQIQVGLDLAAEVKKRRLELSPDMSQERAEALSIVADGCGAVTLVFSEWLQKLVNKQLADVAKTSVEAYSTMGITTLMIALDTAAAGAPFAELSALIGQCRKNQRAKELNAANEEFTQVIELLGEFNDLHKPDVPGCELSFGEDRMNHVDLVRRAVCIFKIHRKLESKSRTDNPEEFIRGLQEALTMATEYLLSNPLGGCIVFIAIPRDSLAIPSDS